MKLVTETPHGGDEPNSVWPDMKDEAPRTCAALFIDIRDSSEMSAARGAESLTVASRTRDFIDSTKKLWADGPVPTSVRSIGDGLFCVWVISRHDEGKALRSQILERVLDLSMKLPALLKDKWGINVSLGMGLAHGDAAEAEIGSARDYYGYVINLAAKLQDLARPSGVVVEQSFAKGTQWETTSHLDLPKSASAKVDFLSHVSEVRRLEVPNPATAFHLEPRLYSLPMARDGEVKCLVTPGVDEIHDWTCLAWPGFAITRGGDGKRLGLNARGITVLTHEGLEGKIGSLEIWPRNNHEKVEGDRFELIIDDFDSLCDMHELKIVDLHNAKDKDEDICFALSSGTYHDDFYFMPIRCGLNALAWNSNRAPQVAEHRSYRDTIEASAYEKNALNVGLYDNPGASLPVLIDAFYPASEFDIFSADEEMLRHVIDGIENLIPASKKGRKIFKTIGKIELLADALRNNTVSAVLGGGAWLAGQQSKNVACHIPPESTGFLWVEGAAMLANNRVNKTQLRAFLHSSVLEPEYQRELMRGRPYGSCPVNKELTEEILRGDKENEASLSYSEQLICAETRAVYGDLTLDDFAPNVRLRRTPDKPGEWESAWREIKKRFC